MAGGVLALDREVTARGATAPLRFDAAERFEYGFRVHPSFSCPGCAVASPAPGRQKCARCGLEFAIFPGYASDPSVVPPPPAGNAQVIRVKAPAGFTVRYGVLEVYGVAEGELDPVLAVSEMNKSGVAFPEIVSLTFWRERDWLVAVLAGLTLIPLGLFLLAMFVVLVAAGKAAGGVTFLLFGVGLFGLGAWAVHRGVIVQKHLVRVAGIHRTLRVRFDRGARDAFRLELLRRAGLPPCDMP